MFVMLAGCVPTEAYRLLMFTSPKQQAMSTNTRRVKNLFFFFIKKLYTRMYMYIPNRFSENKKIYFLAYRSSERAFTSQLG